MSQSVASINAKTKKRTITWLIMAGVAVAAWLIVYLSSSAPQAMQNAKTTEVTPQDLPLPSKIDTFDQMTKEVPPLELSGTIIRDLRSYPKEFKDKKYFEKHQSKWTVQVMDVAQNDSITGYLNGRKDRDKFAYFRYKNSKNEQRFVLTYGVMGSEQEAKGAINTVDFGLPNTVKATTKKMQDYITMVDNYERHDEIVDSAPNAPRAVKLNPTRNVIPPTPPKETVKKEQQPVKKSDKPATTQPAGQKTGETITQSAPKASSQTNQASAPKQERSQPSTPKQNEPKRQEAPQRANNDDAKQDKPKRQEAVEYGSNTHTPQEKPKIYERAEPKAEAPKPKEVQAPETNVPKTPGSE